MPVTFIPHAYDELHYDFDSVERSLSQSLQPFLASIRENSVVAIKPNWVKESDVRYKDRWEHVITHPALVWAVARQVDQVLKGQGKITICEAPQTDSSFSLIMKYTDFYNYPKKWPLKNGTPFEVLDLRREEWETENGVVTRKISLTGDPKGYVLFDLGLKSRFEGFDTSHIYGADYDFRFTQQQHENQAHRYLICKTVLDADVVINMPKMKTHKKAGITCALKNLVGINGDKNYLPHFRFGAPEGGGDEFPQAKGIRKTESHLIQLYKRAMTALPSQLVKKVGVPIKNIGRRIFGDTANVIRSGNWYGNDTVWRMVLDLNAILAWGTPEGGFSPKRRTCLHIVDGILAGEGEGPFSPDPIAGDVIIVADDPVVCDYAAALWMGFDPLKIASIREGFKPGPLPLTLSAPDNLQASGSRVSFNGSIQDIATREGKHFKPHSGWKGHIERNLPQELNVGLR
jgi:uncharacterized protein (DUF362 family)